MYKIPLPDLKEKILRSGRLTASQLDERLKEKINQLSGLISEEGAAHIIANELGIELQRQGDKLKIKEVYAGMRDVTVAGKVVRKFDVREFTKDNRIGRVCTLIIGDETGTMRLVFWNDQVAVVERANEGDTLLVKNVYVRENQGTKELHVGERSTIQINPAGEQVGVVRETMEFRRKSIQELQNNEDNIEILGTVIQVFDPRFFSTCPRCRSRVNEAEGKFSCGEHGTVEPETAYVLNLVVDDGTGTIRTVFWKNQIHHLLGKGENDLLVYKNDPPQFEKVKTDLLGEQYKLRGRVKRNEMFDRQEFSVQLVEKASPEEELARLTSQS